MTLKFRCTIVALYRCNCTVVPLQVGVLKGVAKEYFKFQITIDLLQARGVDEGADHEVSVGEVQGGVGGAAGPGSG